MLNGCYSRCVGVYLEGFSGIFFSGRCSWIGAYSLGTVFFTYVELMRASKVYTSACILHVRWWHVSGDRLGWFGVNIFYERCSWMGAYSLGIVLDFFFFFSHEFTDLMRALKVLRSACMVYDRYWHVSGDKLGWFRVKNFSRKMFRNGCLLPRDSVGLCFVHIHRFDESFKSVDKCMYGPW